jgi:ribosomal protein L11 methyltransferase
VRVAEVVIDVPRGARTAAEHAAYALGAQGLEIRDEDTGGAPGRVQVILWLPASTTRAAVEELIAPQLSDARVRVRRVEADWLTAPAPRRVGSTFVITADDRGVGDRVAIRVEPALGFGDGTHETTSLCVEAIERVIARRRVRSMLDVGTGTGVLAIAAGKLGVEEIVATDIDPLARDAARVALRRNDVRARVQTRLPARTFDLVVANLYFEPLRALAPELAKRVADGGTVIVSGFTQERPIVEAFSALTVTRRRTRGAWSCLELTPRRPTSITARPRRQ